MGAEMFKETIEGQEDNLFLSLSQEINLKDLDALKKLKNFDFILLDVKITPVSSLLEKKILSISLLPKTAIMCILRNKEIIFPSDFDIFKEDDIVFLLTIAQNEMDLRMLFTS